MIDHFTDIKGTLFSQELEYCLDESDNTAKSFETRYTGEEVFTRVRERILRRRREI